MSGLLALLDDVAAIAKVAAASVDDIAAQAVKAGSKAAGAAIDDAAVTPKYMAGFPAGRELPIVRRIAVGSLKNKVLILLPAALALSAFAPWLIAPLLMLGGAYLCFEGAEKVAHVFLHHEEDAHEQPKTLDAAHLEEKRVKGAIKTDFILSAEIMTIALSSLPETDIVTEAATLLLVAIGITVLVYGAVALIVKADDAGLGMAEHGRLAATRAAGRAIVRGMPGFLKGLTTVGTAAMLWVGGSILVHGLAVMGWHAPEDLIHDAAVAVGAFVQVGRGAIEWGVTALADGLLGLALGAALIPLVDKVLLPASALVRALFPEKQAGGAPGAG